MVTSQREALRTKQAVLEADYRQSKRLMVAMADQVQFEKRQNATDLEALYQRYHYVMQAVAVDVDHTSLMNQLATTRNEIDQLLNHHQSAIKEQIESNEAQYRKTQQNLLEK
ncbi:hypothetical protein [Latilactobacillus fuchuensis]|uniref:Uncharacterized protein n=1 Tax=Latilactobacillus fuchuensis TaxID=164393 RepID=A0A2N9DWW3_9LACO|nr:hypothetical protein [Latilactobacillus fuchuensis]SPC39160.1 hypothetical protein LFUMFP_310197 [Latilactobacillus fuchuensis]